MAHHAVYDRRACVGVLKPKHVLDYQKERNKRNDVIKEIIRAAGEPGPVQVQRFGEPDPVQVQRFGEADPVLLQAMCKVWGK